MESWSLEDGVCEAPVGTLWFAAPFRQESRGRGGGAKRNKKLSLCTSPSRSVAKGGGKLVPITPKFFGHFYQNSNKLTFGQIFCTLKTPSFENFWP